MGVGVRLAVRSTGPNLLYPVEQEFRKDLGYRCEGQCVDLNRSPCLWHGTPSLFASSVGARGCSPFSPSPERGAIRPGQRPLRHYNSSGHFGMALRMGATLLPVARAMGFLPEAGVLTARNCVTLLHIAGALLTAEEQDQSIVEGKLHIWVHSREPFVLQEHSRA